MIIKAACNWTNPKMIDKTKKCDWMIECSKKEDWLNDR